MLTKHWLTTNIKMESPILSSLIFLRPQYGDEPVHRLQHQVSELLRREKLRLPVGLDLVSLGGTRFLSKIGQHYFNSEETRTQDHALKIWWESKTYFARELFLSVAVIYGFVLYKIRIINISDNPELLWTWTFDTEDGLANTKKWDTSHFTSLQSTTESSGWR